MTKQKRYYGEKMNFRSLSCAPVNEQGVVYLFGVLHDTFDFKIESIQTGFPDCIARRKITEEKWEELNIEFEFESKSFKKHNHDPDKTDMIICWRHNWEDCPDDIEVIELKSMLDELSDVNNEITGNNKKLTEYQKFCQEKRLQGYTFKEIAPIWRKRKEKGKEEKPLTEYQKFAQEKRLEGKSFKEISKLWKEFKKKESR